MKAYVITFLSDNVLYYLIHCTPSFEVIESFASVAYFTIAHGTLHHFQFCSIRCLDQCTFLGMISKLFLH